MMHFCNKPISKLASFVCYPIALNYKKKKKVNCCDEVSNIVSVGMTDYLTFLSPRTTIFSLSLSLSIGKSWEGKSGLLFYFNFFYFLPFCTVQFGIPETVTDRL